MSEEIKRIEAVLDEKVRPTMRAHGGEIQIDRLENGASYEAYEAILEHLVYAKKINYEQAINNRKSIFKL
mgnify:CR=1 FL=1